MLTKERQHLASTEMSKKSGHKVAQDRSIRNKPSRHERRRSCSDQDQQENLEKNPAVRSRRQAKQAKEQLASTQANQQTTVEKELIGRSKERYHQDEMAKENMSPRKQRYTGAQRHVPSGDVGSSLRTQEVRHGWEIDAVQFFVGEIGYREHAMRSAWMSSRAIESE
ncbi:hypothetical protein SISSUDRAFT_1032167 [Sistotremastrum suecicum HHB10207 ss-3]|uniref:Uncharacterized protein n=1 Tax=Sistotremastrum suecicum HHB10207 ss-3 TaxID=1314776 RepID=A0A166EX74_9AGAM|nr:hypothetical protein SISSUDRAFT_1032167 [Sistotremastrum suecicum HHB10207 ss-3]